MDQLMREKVGDITRTDRESLWEEVVSETYYNNIDVFETIELSRLSVVVRSRGFDVFIGGFEPTPSGGRIILAREAYDMIPTEQRDYILKCIARHELCHAEAYFRSEEWFVEDGEFIQSLFSSVNAPVIMSLTSDPIYIQFCDRKEEICNDSIMVRSC